MKRFLSQSVALMMTGSLSWAARCTTVVDPRALQEYSAYVSSVETARASESRGGELWWSLASAKEQAAKSLDSGKPVRHNISPSETNQRIAQWNGTIIHWIGAIRIQQTDMTGFKSVLQDYPRCASIYDPIVYDCQAQPIPAETGESYEVTYGYQNVYRVALAFPQHYSFLVRSRMDYRDAGSPADPHLVVHQRASEIRESDSGVPGRDDFLEPFHDHGILWGLNTYWRARPNGPDLYVEFEAITLARSVRDFSCKIGFLPVPKSVVAKVADSLPAESLQLMLVRTKSESERRARQRDR